MPNSNTNEVKTKGFLELNSFVDKLIAYKEELNDLSSSDLETRMLTNLRIIGLARKFASIDNRILELVNSSELSGTYFSEILTLETLRLRFKEELTRCENLKQIQA